MRRRQSKAVRRLLAEVGDMRAAAAALPVRVVAEHRPDFTNYRGRPLDFGRDILGVETVWDAVAEILLGVHQPPYQISVDSGHSTGKTFSLAWLVNYWYWTTTKCWVISTAPTERDVKDALWTEIRLQQQTGARKRNVKFPPDLMPAACEMRSGDDHVAKGYTARDANSAQGRHRENMLFVFDEKEGVGAPFWDGMKSMFRPGSGDAAVVVGNPFTTTTRAYFEHMRSRPDGTPVWRRIHLSSLDHPNIAAGLRGDDPLPVPSAVTPEQVDNWVSDWCDPVVAGDEKATDIKWRVKADDGSWQFRTFRPGPVGEPRILGRRPSAGTDGVWSEAVFNLTLGPPVFPDWQVLPVLGIDSAGKGFDFSVIHSRCGGVSLTHEAGSGWSSGKIAARAIETAESCAAWWNARRSGNDSRPIGGVNIPINVEDDAYGREVQAKLRERGYLAYPVSASGAARKDDQYPNRRSEVWFTVRNRAALGGVNFSLLPRDVRERLQQQLLAPKWESDGRGRRVVEPKDETKKKLGRSPDDADATNCSYIEPGDGGIAVVHRPPAEGPKPMVPGGSRDWAAARGINGLGR